MSACASLRRRARRLPAALRACGVVLAALGALLTSSASATTAGRRVVSLASTSSPPRLWVGTTTGLARIEGTTGSIRWLGPADGLPAEPIAHLAAAPDRTLWAATPGGFARARADADGAFTPALTGMPGTEATCTLPLASGVVYGGTSRGIVVWEPEAERWRALYETHEFARDRVLACAAGPDGSAWFAKRRQLTRIAPDGTYSVVHVNPLAPDRRVPLGSTSATAIAFTARGHLWVATEAELTLLDELRAVRVERYAPAPWNGSLPMRWVHAIVSEPDGTTWLLPSEGDPDARGWVARRPGNGSATTPWQRVVVPARRAGALAPIVYVLHRDAAGVLWAGTSDGLYRASADAGASFTPWDGP